MAIKGGQLVHVGDDTVVIDRIQTAGPGNLNIPTEKIYELGNYESVATIRDVPDLQFSMESFDTSTEIEEWLTGGNPATGIAMNAAKCVDVVSPFKAGKDAAQPFDVINSVGLPYLSLESIQYRFGLRDNSRQTIGLRGDSIFYNPGSTYVQKVMGTGAAGQAVLTAHPAYAYTDANGTRRVLSVEVGNQRLTLGPDYTLTDAGAAAGGADATTVTLAAAVPAITEIRVMYATPDVRSYPQSVHETTAVKPAAVRGKDIDIYLGGYDSVTPANSAANKLSTVQAVTVDWRVTLEKDEEFGNYFSIGQDYDVPVVNGTVDIKPKSPDDLFAKLRKITGVGANQVIGPNLAVALPLDIVIKDGNNAGAVLKRLHVDDARFTIPGFQGRVQQKLTMTLNWESDGGNLLVYDN